MVVCKANIYRLATTFFPQRYPVCTNSRALNLVKLGKDLTDPMSLPCKVVNDEKRK